MYEYDECGVCGHPMQVMPLNTVQYCSGGLRCEYHMLLLAERICYLGPLAVIPLSELGLIEYMLDAGIVKSIADIYTADYAAIATSGRISHIISGTIKGNIARVLTTVSLCTFIDTLEIPGVDLTDPALLLSLGRMFNYSGEYALRLSIGSLLSHWDSRYGVVVNSSDPKEIERGLYYFEPHGTKVQIQELSNLFARYWCTAPATFTRRQLME